MDWKRFSVVQEMWKSHVSCCALQGNLALGIFFSTFLYRGVNPKSSYLSPDLFMSRDVAKECLL